MSWVCLYESWTLWTTVELVQVWLWSDVLYRANLHRTYVPNMIRVTANSSYGFQQQFVVCNYPNHSVFFSCGFLHFQTMRKPYHFSLKFNDTLNMTQNTKEYCVIIAKSTIVKPTRNIARHLGISVPAVTDTTFTPVMGCHN